MQEFALGQSTVALVGNNTLDFNLLDDSLGGTMSIFGARLHNFGPGIRILQNKAIERKFDIPRLINNWSIIAICGYVHETTDMKAQKGSPLQELSTVTTTSRKGFATASVHRFHDYSTLRIKRRHWIAFVDRHNTWKKSIYTARTCRCQKSTVSSPKYLPYASDLCVPGRGSTSYPRLPDYHITAV